MTLLFECSNLHLESPVATADDLILGYVGDFRIVTTRGRIYGESNFPCIEFVREVAAWLEQDSASDFEYDSSEAAEPGLVWIRRAGAGWRVGSIHQDEIEMSAYSKGEIRSAVKDLVRSISLRGTESGLEVKDVLPRL